MTKNEKLTEEKRNWAIAQYPVLAQIIDEGNWDYSKSQLLQELNCYKQSTWVEVNPVKSFLLAFLFFPLGFIPLIFVFLALAMQKKHRDQYETHLVKLRNGRLVNKSSSPNTSSDEIVKFYQLYKDGVITEDEFTKFKNKKLNAG